MPGFYDQSILTAIEQSDRPLRHRDLAEMLAPGDYAAFSYIGNTLTKLWRLGLVSRQKTDGRYWHYTRRDRRITQAADVPSSHKIALYDALATHFVTTLDRYYTQPTEADPQYDSGAAQEEPTETVLIEMAGDSLYVTMAIAGWCDFLGFRVELPTLTRDAMEWEGGPPTLDPTTTTAVDGLKDG